MISEMLIIHESGLEIHGEFHHDQQSGSGLSSGLLGELSTSGMPSYPGQDFPSKPNTVGLLFLKVHPAALG